MFFTNLHSLQIIPYSHLTLRLFARCGGCAILGMNLQCPVTGARGVMDSILVERKGTYARRTLLSARGLGYASSRLPIN